MRILSHKKDGVNMTKDSGANIWDILLPCYLYEICVREQKVVGNILEETIKKLIAIDSKYKNIDELAKILKLDNENIDIKEVLELAVQRVIGGVEQDSRDVYGDDSDEASYIYCIFQERYSGEVLRYILHEDSSFLRSEFQEKIRFLESKEIKNIDKDLQKVTFDVSQKSKTSAYLESIKPSENPPELTLDKILEAIAIYNQNAPHKIRMNIDIDVPKNKEEVYLHCKVVLKDGLDFRVTNGFTGAFSPLLESVLKEHGGVLLKKLRESRYQSSDEVQESEYKKIHGDARDELVWNLKRFESSEKENEKTRFLYNAIEKYFEYLARKERYRLESLDKEMLSQIAKNLGFSKCDIRLFMCDGKPNLKSYFAQILRHKHEKLALLASDFPQFLGFLYELHEARNIQSHGNKDERQNAKNMDIKELEILKDALVQMGGTDFRESQRADSLKTDSKKHNGIVLLEKDMGENIMQNLSDADIKDLARVYHALDSSAGTLSLEIFSDVVLGLSRVCESALLRFIEVHKFELREQNFKPKIREIKAKNEGLKNVGEHYIENAMQGREASLGAYLVVYLLLNENEDCAVIAKLQRLGWLRHHANHNVYDLQKTSLSELRDLKTSVMDFIQKIMILD